MRSCVQLNRSCEGAAVLVAAQMDGPGAVDTPPQTPRFHLMSPAGAARDRSTQIRRVLLGLLVANVAVVGAKFVIGAVSGSLAVLGDAVHSSVDVINNVVALAVSWIAAREPDEEHPYGHEPAILPAARPSSQAN